MNTLVNCPKCKAEIESDSYHCDQCGVELYMCPECHVFGKGKRCTQCGQPLVTAKEVAGNVTSGKTFAGSDGGAPSALIGQAAAQSEVADKPAPVVGESLLEKTMRPGAAAIPLPARLTSSAAGIRLGLGDGAIIGRKKGNYITAFAKHSYVSSIHARLQKSPAGKWEIVDLDSTNGTFINGNRLSPNVPAVFNIGDIISIANIDFKVE